MWILVVEALGALMLFLFIVWWTLGPTERRERDALKAAEDEVSASTPTAASERSAGSDSHPR